MDIVSIGSDRWVSTRVRLKRDFFGRWRTAFRDGHWSLGTQTLKCLGHPASKGALLVGLSCTLVTTHADEQRFGDWYGEIDPTSSSPVSITAYSHIDSDSSSTLWLGCTPPSWNDGRTTGAAAGNGRLPPVQPTFGGLLMDHSPKADLERAEGWKELEPCVVEARVMARDGNERIVRSQGQCYRNGVDASQVDSWGDLLDLLTHPLSDEQPRITVERHDGSKFALVAPKRYNTGRARTWMEDTCRRMWKSEGRVTVPGPTYGVWFTQYTYDLFYEKKLAGTIGARAHSGANEVALACGGSLSVFHRTEGCMHVMETDATWEGGLASCRIAMRVDGGVPVEQEALCPSSCFSLAQSTDNDVVAAMLAAVPNSSDWRKGVKMRVTGPSDMHRRDFELSLWGFDSAHGWVSSECAAASDG